MKVAGKNNFIHFIDNKIMMSLVVNNAIINPLLTLKDFFFYNMYQLFLFSNQ